MFRLAPIFAALFLTACAATPYQEFGLTGGVSASLTSSDTAEIEVTLNSLSSDSLLIKYTLLKSAELTIENGFEHFHLVSHLVGADVVVVSGVRHRKPKSKGTIQMRPGPKPADAPGDVYDAQQVIDVIGPQVK